jgi:hypothetical protein
VLGVLQAETIAHRSFSVFPRVLSMLPEDERPIVVGVLLNMLQASEASSVDVLRSACGEFPPAWLFDVTVPRHPELLRASAEGLPLNFDEVRHQSGVASLFEGLACEVEQRLELRPPSDKSPRRLLL